MVSDAKRILRQRPGSKMEITESAISHQLRALRIARLAQSHKAGKNVIYSLQDEHIRWILEKTYDHISER